MVIIKAVYRDNERESMEFIASLTMDNCIDKEKEIKGCSIEWEESENNYTKWQFTVTPDEGHDAYIEWTDGSSQKTTIDLMKRNIVVGATFKRRDANHGDSSYEITSVTMYNVTGQFATPSH